MSKKLINLNGRSLEMAEDLMRIKGFMGLGEVVRYTISEAHAKTFPAYTTGQKLTPEQKLEQKQAMKKAKEAQVEQEYLEIAELLGGKVETNPETGNKTCVYYTYSLSKRYQQRVPLAMLSKDMLKNQYQPSKEKVLQLQKDKKVNY